MGHPGSMSEIYAVHAACAQGNVDRLVALKRQNPFLDLNACLYTDQLRWSPLYRAIVANQHAVVAHLVGLPEVDCGWTSAAGASWVADAGTGPLAALPVVACYDDHLTLGLMLQRYRSTQLQPPASFWVALDMEKSRRCLRRLIQEPWISLHEVHLTWKEGNLMLQADPWLRNGRKSRRLGRLARRELGQQISLPLADHTHPCTHAHTYTHLQDGVPLRQSCLCGFSCCRADTAGTGRINNGAMKEKNKRTAWICQP